MDKRDLTISDFAKLWLAHDGLWFQAVENEFGLEAAIRLDKAAWGKFSPIEADRILDRLGQKPGGGIEQLEQALAERLYAFINRQRIVEKDEKRLVFEMTSCRVQDARRRKNLPLLPCKEVGIVEYSTFAETIDPRIKTTCLRCPPDDYNGEHWCRWEFTLDSE
ncbi:MAG: hypothetical protein A2W25_01985 [candidate division Zixibacteria bacterium RBG_16_53_22]|nr:MAG: hypothetical protein A2W25_01985 [candidate division Zixibacteria bacterium RBG_16_53_22]